MGSKNNRHLTRIGRYSTFFICRKKRKNKRYRRSTLISRELFGDDCLTLHSFTLHESRCIHSFLNYYCFPCLVCEKKNEAKNIKRKREGGGGTRWRKRQNLSKGRILIAFTPNTHTRRSFSVLSLTQQRTRRRTCEKVKEGKDWHDDWETIICLHVNIPSCPLILFLCLNPFVSSLIQLCSLGVYFLLLFLLHSLSHLTVCFCICFFFWMVHPIVILFPVEWFSPSFSLSLYLCYLCDERDQRKRKLRVLPVR